MTNEHADNAEKLLHTINFDEIEPFRRLFFQSNENKSRLFKGSHWPLLLDNWITWQDAVFTKSNSPVTEHYGKILTLSVFES